MAMYDQKSVIQSVDLGTVTLSGETPGATQWVDLEGFEACTLILRAATITDAGTADGFTLQVQHGDTLAAADAANVTGSSAQVTSNDDDDKIVAVISYVGDKRYVRVNGTGTTGTDATYLVTAILGHPEYAPTTAIGTSLAAT